MKFNPCESEKSLSLKVISEKSSESSRHLSNQVKKSHRKSSNSSFEIEQNKSIYESAKELDIKIVKSLDE